MSTVAPGPPTSTFSIELARIVGVTKGSVVPSTTLPEKTTVSKPKSPKMECRVK